MKNLAWKQLSRPNFSLSRFENMPKKNSHSVQKGHIIPPEPMPIVHAPHHPLFCPSKTKYPDYATEEWLIGRKWAKDSNMWLAEVRSRNYFLNWQKYVKQWVSCKPNCQQTIKTQGISQTSPIVHVFIKLLIHVSFLKSSHETNIFASHKKFNWPHKSNKTFVYSWPIKGNKSR